MLIKKAAQAAAKARPGNSLSALAGGPLHAGNLADRPGHFECRPPAEPGWTVMARSKAEGPAKAHDFRAIQTLARPVPDTIFRHETGCLWARHLQGRFLKGC
jgi:hypothetical protein